MKTKTAFHIALTRACALFALTAMVVSTGRAANFTEAKITDLAGNVTITPKANPTAPGPAQLNGTFTAPDTMSTGPKSRVQLTSTQDGTIARIGSNTVFSIEESSRTLNLKSGSVLFSAPKGMSSSIISGGATATVEGFTVIASATADGGFKLVVLEGTATVKLPNGQIVTLTPGQMTYILPASKGGGVGPILNFDLKKEAQSSGLVNGFTLSLPSENLIVDATNQQQLKISAGTLTPTGQVAVGAVSSDQVFLVDSTTFDNVNNVNNPPTTSTAGDLVLGPTGGLTLPAANTFVNPGKTFSAGQLGLPGGVIPNDSVTANGLVGGNVSASGVVDLSSLDGLPVVDILSQKVFAFTAAFSNISSNLSISPSLAAPSLDTFYPNSTISYVTLFSDLSTSLHLNLIAQNGFTFNESTTIEALFGPPVFTNLQNFNSIVTPTLAGPSISFSSTNFKSNFSMTSLLQDFAPSNISIENPTGNLLLQSIAGDVVLHGDFVVAGFGGNLVLQSKLGAVDIYDGFTAANSTANASVFVNAGTNAELSTGRGSNFLSASFSNGTVQISARGDVTVDSNSTIQAVHQNLFAGGLLTESNAFIAGSPNSSATYVLGGNTVNLSNINFTGASKVGLYSKLGVLNINATPVDGDVNFITGVQYNGTSTGNSTTPGPQIGMNILIGRTADNPAVQTALGTAVTLGSTPPPVGQIFSNVLFTPEETGGIVGDGYFFIGNGVFGGAVTANGTVDLTGVPTGTPVDVAAYNGFNITGSTVFNLPSGSNFYGLRLFSRLGFNIASGAVISNNLSFGSGNFELDSIASSVFNNVQLVSPNSTITVASEEGSLTFNGGGIISGNFGGGSINLASFGGDQAVTIAGATITGNSFPFGNASVNVLADSVVVSNNSTITTGTSINLVGGTIGVSVSNSSLTSLFGPVNVTSDTDITVANSTLTSSPTPVGSSFTNGRVNLTAAHIVTVKNSTLITPRPVILAGSAINLDGVSMSNSTNIDMQARTINLSNINFPANSVVNLTSQNGMLAPNPNTNAASVIGDVNFITNVMYGGSPAQGFVPVSVGGSSNSSITNKININSSSFHGGG